QLTRDSAVEAPITRKKEQINPKCLSLSRPKIAALPPDVRQVSDLPGDFFLLSTGLCPDRLGHSPKQKRATPRKAKGLPHIGRQSRKRIETISHNLGLLSLIIFAPPALADHCLRNAATLLT